MMLFGAAFVYGYCILSGVRAFWPAIEESLTVPLFGMLLAGPITFAVLASCMVLGLLAHKYGSRFATIAAYALLASYWVFVALALSDIDL
jgi:hypothetical protein